MIENKLEPVKRIQTIDIIRGISLFGILIMNIQTYTLFTFFTPAQVYALPLDRPETYAPTQFLVHVFVEGQFYTIYSFLFGLGFYLMLQKNNASGLNGNRIFKRRLWALLFFGLVHALVFWFGDILHKYAILGFTLIYFNKKSVPVILKWIVALAVFVVVFKIGKVLLFPPGAVPLSSTYQKPDEMVLYVADLWQHGSVWQVMSIQGVGVVAILINLLQNGMVNYVHYEIMFLLGILAGRMDLVHRIPEFKSGLIKTALIILPFALLLKAVFSMDILQVHFLPHQSQAYEELIRSLAGFIGTPLLTFVYLVFLAITLQGKPSCFFSWIGNTGRLGLTNYLMQTVLCMLLFYGYAFGLSGKLTLLQSLLMVVLIYGFQMLYSNLWLKYHSAGPMEKLWRKITYAGGTNSSRRILAPEV